MTSYKILQITDLHVKAHAGDTLCGVDTEAGFRQVLQYAHETDGPFDLILVTGDLAQDPCPDSYRRIGLELNRYPIPSLCLPGNHDDFGLMRQYLENGKVGCGKKMTVGNWLIVALNSQKPNSPAGELAAAELDFLRETLEAEPDRPTLVAVHHHAIASGSSWMDGMRIENGEALVSLLGAYPQVKAVVCGHLHQALEKRQANIVFWATPATCFQFTPKACEFSLDDAAAGYRIIRLSNDGHLQSDCRRLPGKAAGLNREAHAY